MCGVGLPNVLTLFTENENLHDENNSGRTANFYCTWHRARKKRLHSQLLEFLNTNNILWDQWAGSGPPHPSPPPTNKLGLCSEPVCQAWGGPGGTADLRTWGGGGWDPGAGRCSAGPPHRQGAPARLSPGPACGAPGSPAARSPEACGAVGPVLFRVPSARQGPGRPKASGKPASRNGHGTAGSPRPPPKLPDFALQPAASRRGPRALLGAWEVLFL